MAKQNFICQLVETNKKAWIKYFFTFGRTRLERQNERGIYLRVIPLSTYIQFNLTMNWRRSHFLICLATHPSTYLIKALLTHFTSQIWWQTKRATSRELHHFFVHLNQRLWRYIFSKTATDNLITILLYTTDW